ncbi:hypothetical protein K2Q16_02000 [Patescibacteria group bacterium]|nr:hypothetical protein [Patescibacteria group bacterium]
MNASSTKHRGGIALRFDGEYYLLRSAGGSIIPYHSLSHLQVLLQSTMALQPKQRAQAVAGDAQAYRTDEVQTCLERRFGDAQEVTSPLHCFALLADGTRRIKIGEEIHVTPGPDFIHAILNASCLWHMTDTSWVNAVIEMLQNQPSDVLARFYDMRAATA